MIDFHTDSILPARHRRNEHPAPSPSEISAACAEIRKEWSEREHRKRAAAGRATWRVPVVSSHLSENRRAMAE